jgi:hypothetical protein
MRGLSFESCGSPHVVVSPTGYLIVQKYDQGDVGADYVRLETETIFLIVKDGKYNFHADLVATLIPPGTTTTMSLESYVPCCDSQLLTADVVDVLKSTSTDTLDFVGMFKAGTKLRVRIVSNNLNKILSLKVTGSILFQDATNLLNVLTQFDKNTKCMWIPFRPPTLPAPLFPPQYPDATSQYPWHANTIPHRENQGVPGTPNTYGYGKFKSVPYTVGFYMGLDMRTISPSDPNLSVFLTDLENRGPNNYRKKVYMNAITSDRFKHYDEKIQKFVNTAYSNVTTYNLPVLSSFKKELINFFLAIHIGYDVYPDYVVKYFETFGYGDPDRPGRDAAMLFGYENVDKVRAYFFERLQKILDAGDESTFLYWWAQAGMDYEANVMEAIHNTVAFPQFNNFLYLVIKAKLLGLGTIPGQLVRYDFLAKFKEAPTESAKIDVVREAYRLTVPNNTSFSRVKGTTEEVDARQLNQLIMLTNDPTYPVYSTDKYVDFSTDFSSGVCPMKRKPEDNVVVSPVDNETLLDACNPKLTPVFSTPKFCPFNLGYRACPAVAFNTYLSYAIMERFQDLDFYFAPVIPGTPVVTLAPFSAVPDNIRVCNGLCPP